MTSDALDKWKPIIFSPLMVSKILSGEKTQTRRLVKQNILIAPGFPNEFISLCKFGQKGSGLWVRETWCNGLSDSHECWSYRADMKYQCGKSIPDDGLKRWKPSIFMPRRACRLFLEITDVKIERLLETSKLDAISEGFPDVKGFLEYFYKINPKLCDPNPYVWAITFKPIIANPTNEQIYPHPTTANGSEHFNPSPRG